MSIFMTQPRSCACAVAGWLYPIPVKLSRCVALSALVLAGDFSPALSRRAVLCRVFNPGLRDDLSFFGDIIARYENGALLNFHLSINNPRNTETGWIEGSKGSLEWEWSDPSSIRYYPNTHKKQSGEIISIEAMTGSQGTQLTDFNNAGFSSFLNSIHNLTQTTISLKDGLWSVLIALAAKKSAETNQIQNLQLGL